MSNKEPLSKPIKIIIMTLAVALVLAWGLLAYHIYLLPNQVTLKSSDPNTSEIPLGSEQIWFSYTECKSNADCNYFYSAYIGQIKVLYNCENPDNIDTSCLERIIHKDGEGFYNKCTYYHKPSVELIPTCIENFKICYNILGCDDQDSSDIPSELEQGKFLQDRYGRYITDDKTIYGVINELYANCDIAGGMIELKHDEMNQLTISCIDHNDSNQE